MKNSIKIEKKKNRHSKKNSGAYQLERKNIIEQIVNSPVPNMNLKITLLK